MNTTIKVILVILAAVLLASMLIGNAKASELSDYRDLVNNQTTLRNYYALQDMAYTYGGMDKLEARMEALNDTPVYHVNAYARYDPSTMNLYWEGSWATN
jgi:hypothetical protein